ncbi:MAG: hypothetical protein AB8G18_18640 [Gammaproteobacteria bacterium]
MKGENIFRVNDARKVVTVDDVQLLIVATRLAPMEWSVRVENERGIRTEWHEIFSSVEKAMQTAQAAIDKEGVAEFISIEGFEYLDW